MIKDPGRNKRIRENRLNLHLTDLQKEILLGITLGDATIRPTGCVKFEQSIKREAYVNHLYDVFKDFVNAGPKIRNIVGGGAKDRQSITFQTYQHPDFLEFRNKFYKEVEDKNGKFVYKKSICDLEFLNKWFMDDGSFRKNNEGIIVNFTLCSHGFTKEENDLLSNFLNNKFGLFTSVYRDDNHYYINVKVRDVFVFRNLIKDYVHFDFFYKLYDTNIL
jgi:hypothetical protein